MKIRGFGQTLIVAAALAGGCVSNPARSAAAVPLEIPEPPPKPAIAPVPAAEAAPARPAAPPTATAAPAPAPTTAGAAAPPSAPATTSPEPARPSPAPELRPAGSAGRALTDAQVRESVDRTKQKLDAIDRQRLNAGKRADYDSARRFLAQADTAAKANNLMLAQSSVEKAETLADGLR